MSDENKVGNLGYHQFMQNLKDRSFVRSYPRFLDHAQPRGFLPDIPAAHAAWYYCMCLVGLFRELDAGNAEYEGERDHTNMANNILRSVAALYQLDSPSLILQQLPAVRLEAANSDLGWDTRFETAHLEGQRSMDN